MRDASGRHGGVAGQAGLSRRAVLGGVAVAALAPPDLRSQDNGGDPLGTLQWPGVRDAYLGRHPFRFDPAIEVYGPAYADDAMNVPVRVDATAYAGRVRNIVIVVDRNPIRKVLDFQPLRMQPRLAFRFRLQQVSPVRALVRLDDGSWRVGGTRVEAAGGGCTVPGLSRADGSWTSTVGQVQAQLIRDYLQRGHGRLRLRVMHPMDTGLVAGIPAYYLEHLEARGRDGQAWWKLDLFEPVSENPLLTFDFAEPPPLALRIVGRDTAAVRVDAEVRP